MCVCLSPYECVKESVCVNSRGQSVHTLGLVFFLKSKFEGTWQKEKKTVDGPC